MIEGSDIYGLMLCLDTYPQKLELLRVTRTRPDADIAVQCFQQREWSRESKIFAKCFNNMHENLDPKVAAESRC